MQEMVRFENISKRFGGVHALNNVSFSIDKGSVHALLGENGAGKSTLMNILSGLIAQDEGRIIYKGEEVKISSPSDARALGIATVHQELKNCDNLTVTENVFLGREEKNGRIIGADWKTMNEKARKILEGYGLNIDVKTPLNRLTVAQKQMIEIAKAIDMNADVVILDEPTSALTINETEKLFDNIRQMKEKGICIIYISHRLEEIFEICDKVSMLRNGEYLGTSDIKDITADEIIRSIAGKDLNDKYDINADINKEEYVSDEIVLKVRNLKSAPSVEDVSFDLHRGEILGFYGLQGSGRTETMQAIFGITAKEGGTIEIFGKEISNPGTKESITNKVVMITEERKRDGVFYNMDINDNMAVIHDKKITSAGIINTKSVSSITKEYINKLSIKCSDQHQLIGNLSGGNQQKVILSRCLSVDPEILILDEPTRGVDVGAKAEIYDILRDLRKNEGKSMIVVSSELPEIIMLCDRVIVMHAGVVTGEVKGEAMTKETILKYAFNE